jgi:Uncharacterised nucleotidyltransferase
MHAPDAREPAVQAAPSGLDDNAHFALSLLAMAHEIARSDFGRRAALQPHYTAARLDYLAARKIYGLAFIGAAQATPLFALYRKVWLAQRAALQSLVAELASRGLDVLIYKGAETTERHYGSHPVCLRGDIDLLVRPGQLAGVKAAMTECGLVQADYDTENCRLIPLTPEQLESTERGRYNLRSFASLIDIPLTSEERALGPRWLTPVSLRAEHATLVLGIDISIGLDQKIGSDEMFDRSRASVFAGARTLSEEDHVWYTATLFYLQTFLNKQQHKLTQMADLIATIGNHGDRIDWAQVVALGQRHGGLPALYYPIAYIDRLIGGGAVPGAALDALQPVHGSRSRDYGWQIAKLFGRVDEFPAAFLPA